MALTSYVWLSDNPTGIDLGLLLGKCDFSRFLMPRGAALTILFGVPLGQWLRDSTPGWITDQHYAPVSESQKPKWSVSQPGVKSLNYRSYFGNIELKWLEKIF